MRRVTPLFLLLLSILSSDGLAAEGSRLELSLAADFSVELEAAWEPLTDTVYKFEEQYPWLVELRPAQRLATYEAASFRAFLPPGEVSLGEVWPIEVRDALPFLRQLHPGATERLHHGLGSDVAAPGAWAVLRAISPTHAEVLLRVHADFLLRGTGGREDSSWMTPAQFAGRMVIDRERGIVTAFELALPFQSANVDLNMATEWGISADIGCIPRLEVRGGTGPSANKLVFVEEIDLELARTGLRQQFYPFASLDWLPLDEALVQSRVSGKPLHVVVLFGSLDDESC